MTTRALLLEPVGGIAGDMFLAAALDLGVSLAALEAPLRTLGVTGWTFAVTRAERHAIVGTHVDVVLDATLEHPHRGYTDIAALISASGLSAGAKANALKVFRLIGEAEAKIHGTTLDAIHFHEVGAVDSIVDICGAAVALELLGDPRVFCTPPPLGSGTTRIAHGVVPVPVPATLELLRDVPVRFEGVGELTTPTGAALVKAFATVGAPPELTIERIGYGVGTKDFRDRANVLRASLGRTTAQASSLTVLECNLDDCSPQVLGALVETLLTRGALDAWVAPVVMKKGRPGHLVGVLAAAEVKDALVTTLLEETTTLGVRETLVTRTALERRWQTVATPWGEVRVKLGLRGERVLNATPEFEDCRAVAQRVGVPLKEVQAAAAAAYFASTRR
jgi:uncharacterized protein (TIGR00299 family) protein